MLTAGTVDEAVHQMTDRPVDFEMLKGWQMRNQGVNQPKAEHSPHIHPLQACCNTAMDRSSSTTCMSNGHGERDAPRGQQDQTKNKPAQLMGKHSGLSSKETESPQFSGSAASAKDTNNSAEASTSKSSKSQRARRKRSTPKQASAAEEDRRRQRRLQKNRVTAAVSRERKRAQFNDLQSRVDFLSKDNDRLTLELQSRKKELNTVKGKLASLTKGASGISPSQPAFESAEPNGCPSLIDMPNSLQSNPDHLILNQFQDHFQTLDTHWNVPLDNNDWDLINAPSLPLSGLYGGVPAEQGFSTSLVDPQYCSGYTEAPLQCQHQAKQECDFGGPVVSLGQED